MTLVRSPMLMNGISGRAVKASNPLKRNVRAAREFAAGARALDGLRDGADMGGRGPAAAAENVQPSLLGPFVKLRRESFGRFRKPGFGQWIRQAGVGISADEKGAFVESSSM